MKPYWFKGLSKKDHRVLMKRARENVNYAFKYPKRVSDNAKYYWYMIYYEHKKYLKLI